MQRHEVTVLVTGATGTVGGATARELLGRGARVRALVREPGRARGLAGADLVQGDLRDEAALDALLSGVDVAFYVSPHEPDEEALAAAFTEACERHGVRLVFVGVHIDAPGRLLRTLLRLWLGRLMPAYRPKMRLSERVRNSRARPIVLMPTNFFDNDELFRDELLAGSFVQPFDRPFNRVAVGDIAEAAARVCLDPNFPSGAYPIVGPASLDGRDCAVTWARELGRAVEYSPDDGAFRDAVLRATSGKKTLDLLSSYAAIRNIQMPTSQKDLARTTALLGRAPTPYAEYVRARVSEWTRGTALVLGTTG